MLARWMSTTTRRSRTARTPPQTPNMPIPGDWSDWQRHMAQRKGPPALAGLFSMSQTLPLRWGLPLDTAGLVVDGLGSTPHGKKKAQALPNDEAANGWREKLAGHAADCPLALEALAWCHALPKLTESL